MDIMHNITLEREKFYASQNFKNPSNSNDVEVVYTWKMDFNRSLLSAATLLVPKSPTSAPASMTMPLWAHNSWVCLFAAMLAVAIGGNAIVIWIVTAHRRMRTVTNYFLVNLSFADLMMASLNCLFNFIYMLHSDWVFGVRYCQLSNFIANVTVAASVFTLTGISFDRYQAIVRPMRPRMSKTCSLIMIAGIWVSGMLLAIPCLLYSTTKEYRSKGTLKTACLLSWPDGLPDVSYMDFVTLRVPIYVSEMLTPRTKILLSSAKKLVKDGLFKFCWISKGVVLLRKSEGEPAIVVTRQEDLEEAKLQAAGKGKQD
ncbi:tachykinin-like peptides receptor 86C [Ostrinia furnacalis]|uniref:tachykinin-like peptides receptor 86C n=1 Tax=Ostrinia furnacalis TaxID=93504 RepID=UPI00103F5B11|nr:tachykinin-like peptides receptor 86C [Ostrinia furnacalis]